MNCTLGYIIPPNVHNPMPSEVLFAKSGRVGVDFYSDTQEYLESAIPETGDVILLTVGGYGFEMLEPSKTVELNQGSYAGEGDRTRFAPVVKAATCGNQSSHPIDLTLTY